MIDLLSQSEGQPTSYPTVTGLSTEAAALDASALWQRIESYIRYRWNTRTVTWVVDGLGNWLPPLEPYTISGVKEWDGDSFEVATLPAAPLGLYFEGGTFEIKATVGSTETPPEAVLEAFRRLAEYIADGIKYDRPAHSQSVSFGSAMNRSIDRSAQWMARSLQYSGAADLLRPYR